MRKLLLAAAVVVLATNAIAEDVCPCIPKAPLWTVTACDTWNCAQSAMIEANGSPYVVALPTSSKEYKWIVLRRVVGGSYTATDGPFLLQSFDSLSAASAMYSTVDPELLPMLTSTVDGKFVLLQLREAETRPNRPLTPVSPPTP